MKNIYLIALAAFLSGTATAQLKKFTLVGVERNKEFIVTANKKNLLKDINDNFDGNYNKVTIGTDYTIGEKKEKFYYLNISSSHTGARLVRWLSHNDGKLYLETTGKNDVSHLDFYASCEGEQHCEPHLVSLDNELNWICGDVMGGSGDKKGDCKKEVSVLDVPFN